MVTGTKKLDLVKVVTELNETAALDLTIGYVIHNYSAAKTKNANNKEIGI